MKFLNILILLLVFSSFGIAEKKTESNHLYDWRLNHGK